MAFNSISGILAGLVLVAVFVLAIVGKMSFLLAGLFAALAIAILLRYHTDRP
jgi:hypothetical protein